MPGDSSASHEGLGSPLEPPQMSRSGRAAGGLFIAEPPCLETMRTFPQPKMSADWEQPFLGLCSQLLAWAPNCSPENNGYSFWPGRGVHERSVSLDA